MGKVNKIIILNLFFISFASAAGSSYMVSPYCLCSVPLQNAFSNIHTEVIDNNIIPIRDKLKEYNKKVVEDTDRVEKENLLLGKEIKLAAKELLVLKQQLRAIKKQNEILILNGE